MKRQAGLLDVANAVSKGTLKIEEVPTGTRKAVQRITDTLSSDQLSTYTQTPPPSRTPSSWMTPCRTRFVRS